MYFPLAGIVPEIKKRLQEESPFRQGQVIFLHPGEVSMIDIPSPVSFIGTSQGDRRHIDTYECVARVTSGDVANSRQFIIDSLVAGMVKAELDYFYRVLFGSSNVVFADDEKVEQTQRLFNGLKQKVSVLPESIKKKAEPLYRNVVCFMRVDLELVNTGTELVLWELPGIIIKHDEYYHYSPFRVQ